MKKIFRVLGIAALFLGCTKSAVDNQNPVITLSSPTNNQVFTAGQIVTVTALITDNDDVNQVHLYVNNKANNAEILHFEDHTDTKAYNLSKNFTAQTGITYKIEVDADDHSGNQAKVAIEVSGS